jgi:uncharacterized protein YciI
LKRIVRKLFASSLAAFACTASPFAQQKPDYDMGKMQMIFLSRLPEGKAQDHAKQIGEQHRAYVESLIKDGKLALWGEVTSEGTLREILVIKSESIEETRQVAQSFPLVKAGMLKAEVLSWFAARNVIGTAKMPLTRSNYVFGILVRGSKWTKEQTEETKKIQEGHMANINRLAKMGKLVLAGPFYEDGDRRGVFIFKTESLSEAQALTDTDPAVIAGRLKIDLYRWVVPGGMLP